MAPCGRMVTGGHEYGCVECLRIQLSDAREETKAAGVSHKRVSASLATAQERITLLEEEVKRLKRNEESDNESEEFGNSGFE